MLLFFMPPTGGFLAVRQEIPKRNAQGTLGSVTSSFLRALGLAAYFGVVPAVNRLLRLCASDDLNIELDVLL